MLDATNWDRFVPEGKEVDAIYGDYVLKSDTIVAIVAAAADTRNANLTVKRVGGCVIDLTRLDDPSDQLSCFYPHGGGYEIEGPIAWPRGLRQTEGAAGLAFKLVWRGEQPRPAVVVGYELADGGDYLTVRSLVTNTTGEPIERTLFDGARADGEVEVSVTSAGKPVVGAAVKLHDPAGLVATGRTDAGGRLSATLLPGEYLWQVSSLSRKG